jgi:hypothetical protein
LRRIIVLLLLGWASAQNQPGTAQTPNRKQQVLWEKLEATVDEIDRSLDGVLGIAIQDLTTDQTLLLHGDEVFPQASTIKLRSWPSFIINRNSGPKATPGQPSLPMAIPFKPPIWYPTVTSCKASHPASPV